MYLKFIGLVPTAYHLIAVLFMARQIHFYQKHQSIILSIYSIIYNEG